MATQTLYRITVNGKFISPAGTLAPAGSNDIATFSSIEEVELFLEASSSNGEYLIQTITTKS